MGVATYVGCLVDDCGRPHWGLGYCRTHCSRVQRHGDPLAHVPVVPRMRLGAACRVDGCRRKPHAHDLCKGHLQRLNTHGDVRAHAPFIPARVTDPCVIESCAEKHYGKGYCRLHYRRVMATGSIDLQPRAPRPPCSVPSCDRQCRAGDYCNTHYERSRRTGSVHPDQPIKVYREGICDLDGCERVHYCLGFCVNHYQQRVSIPRRRAREKAALGDVTAEKLQSRIDYYGGRCWMCRAPWTCIDHVKPLVAGGCNWPANLRPACRSCNARKTGQWPYIVPRKAA